MFISFIFFFFFPSRRRHTSLQGDGSSAVCSSDLEVVPRLRPAGMGEQLPHGRQRLARERGEIPRRGPAGELAVGSHVREGEVPRPPRRHRQRHADELGAQDRKSTRLNSSHLVISYAVFCLKKKETRWNATHPRLRPCTSPLRPARPRR